MIDSEEKTDLQNHYEMAYTAARMDNYRKIQKMLNEMTESDRPLRSPEKNEPTLREFARSNPHKHEYYEEVCRYCGYHKLEKESVQKTCSHTNTGDDLYGSEIVCQDCGHKEFQKRDYYDDD